MEFEITSSLDVLRNQQITANFEAVSAWLDEELAPYTAMAVTEETIPQAKTYRANLNKLKTRLDEYRKEVKKAVLVPYTSFEEKAKVLTGKIDTAVANIDGQVKAFEQREAEAKITEIKAEYESYGNAEAREYCPWETIFNSKWGNKTYSLENAKEEVRAALYTAENNLKTIRETGGDDAAYLLDVYKSTHDMTVVMRKIYEIRLTREREEQRKREAEEQRKREAEAGRKVFYASDPDAFAKAKPGDVVSFADADESVNAPVEEEELVTVAFKVTCTKTQLAALGQYLRQANIKYGRA